MPAPLEFQEAFARAMRSPTVTDFRPSGEVTFAVYRNTWLSACLDALAANYPTVLALLGPEFFKAIALDYARLSPPSSPVLAHYGDGFAESLGRGPLAEEYPYLPDVAGLERLWTESYFAPDEPVLGPEEAAWLSPRDLLERPVRLHSSARLGEFSTPAVTIWQAHKVPGGFDELEPAWQPERALVVRKDMRIIVHLVDEPVFGLLADIHEGVPLSGAADLRLERTRGPDVASILAWILEIGALAAPDGKKQRIS